MDKKIAGLLGAAAALTVTTGSGGQAAPAQPLDRAAVTTYGDLLKPVPNAVAALIEDHSARAEANPRVELAQFFRHHHHHHHHHHHGFFGGGVVIAPPAVVGPPGGCWAWGRPFWNGFRWVRRRVWVCD
jgi:hypothetical protein